MDVDVSVPGQTATPPTSPEPEPEPETETAPGWLGRMATQPIPKVDMQALEAAARGEEVSPDAETIDAQAADIQDQLREADEEVAPDDITIEARAGDLQPEIEQEAEPVETISSSSEGDSEEEIPDWLIAAAEQVEPPTEAPSGLPANLLKRRMSSRLSLNRQLRKNKTSQLKQACHRNRMRKIWMRSSPPRLLQSWRSSGLTLVKLLT